MNRNAAAAGVLVLCAGVAAQVQTIFDSQGFESYTLGGLDGQGGWQGFRDAGGLGALPQVVDSSGGNHVVGSKAIRLSVPDTSTAQCGMQRALADLRAQGFVKVTVTYDIYRESSLWLSNLWWWWFDSGDPTYGLQWDVAAAATSSTYPFGWVTGAPSWPTVTDQWRTLRQTWDFTTGQATAAYDGNTGSVAIANIASLTGWAIELGHDEASGTGAETAWIDNFVITGEKPCYANCDGSTIPPILNVQDFSCFLNRFASGDTYANCDGSTTPPALNVLDFGCFLNRFANGCT